MCRVRRQQQPSPGRADAAFGRRRASVAPVHRAAAPRGGRRGRGRAIGGHPGTSSRCEVASRAIPSPDAALPGVDRPGARGWAARRGRRGRSASGGVYRGARPRCRQGPARTWRGMAEPCTRRARHDGARGSARGARAPDGCRRRARAATCPERAPHRRAERHAGSPRRFPLCGSTSSAGYVASRPDRPFPESPAAGRLRLRGTA